MRVDGTGDGDEGFEEAERGVVAVVQTEAVEEEGKKREDVVAAT